MKKLLAVPIILAALPFMAAGLIFEIARFGVICGLTAAEALLTFVFSKGGA